MLWIPPGFAHGFVALEDDTHLVYKCTSEYHKDSERSIIWNDVELAIDWPLPPDVDAQLSEKDAAAPSFGGSEIFP